MTTPVPGPAASVLSAILVTNPNDAGSPLSVAVFSQSGQAPLLPSLGNDVVAMPQDGLLDANGTWTGFLSTLGLPGATAPARWVGSTAAGPPTTGTFSVGDFAVSADGNVYVCTVAGTPGTWAASGSGGTATLGGDATGTVSSATVTNAHLTTQSVSSAQALGPSSAPVVLTDTTTAGFTLTLPAAPAAHSWFIIVDDTGQWNTHNLTIGRNGKNIDGAASNLTLSTQYGKRWLYYDGTQWWSLAAGGTGGVASVTATDTSIVVGGTGTAPTVATGTLDVIATQHPPAANWSNNSHKITSLANGSGAQDAAAFGQIPLVDSTATDITVVGTAQGAGATGKWADAGHTHPDPNVLPADFGFVAWSADPGNANATTAVTNNTITLIAVPLRKIATITNIIVNVTSAGTLTSAENFAGIYDSSGTRQGVTADQTTNWGSTGLKTMALTSAFTNAPAGMYYIAILSNGATPPTFRCSVATGTLANAGLSGASLRFATNGTGTTLPASLTLSSNSTTNNVPVCVVLS